MSNGADHTWRRQESLGVGEGAPACAVSHVLRWGLSALGSSLGQHLAQGDSLWPALLLWRGSAPPSPSRAPLNPATAGLGCNVVTVALPEPGTCPSAPQQPPCRHRGDTHPKPWRGWGLEQTGEPGSLLCWWICHRPPACEDGCPSTLQPAPCFPCFQIPFCLAAVPKNTKDFGTHCPLSALHWAGKRLCFKSAEYTHTQNFITGNGMFTISILMWLIVFKYHQKGFFLLFFQWERIEIQEEMQPW